MNTKVGMGLIMTLAFATVARPADDEEPLTDLRTVLGYPQAYDRIAFETELLYRGTGDIFNPFYTVFEPGAYLNIQAWGNADALWTPEVFSAPHRLFYVDRYKSDLMNRTVAMKPFTWFRARCIVRSDFSDRAWIEILDIQASERRLEKSMLRNMVRGYALWQHGEPQRALVEMEKVHLQGLPAPLAARFEMDHSRAALSAGDSAGAMLAVRRARSLDPDVPKFSYQVDRIRDWVAQNDADTDRLAAVNQPAVDDTEQPEASPEFPFPENDVTPPVMLDDPAGSGAEAPVSESPVSETPVSETPVIEGTDRAEEAEAIDWTGTEPVTEAVETATDGSTATSDEPGTSTQGGETTGSDASSGASDRTDSGESVDSLQDGVEAETEAASESVTDTGAEVDWTESSPPVEVVDWTEEAGNGEAVDSVVEEATDTATEASGTVEVIDWTDGEVDTKVGGSQGTELPERSIEVPPEVPLGPPAVPESAPTEGESSVTPPVVDEQGPGSEVNESSSEVDASGSEEDATDEESAEESTEEVSKVQTDTTGDDSADDEGGTDDETDEDSSAGDA